MPADIIQVCKQRQEEQKRAQERAKKEPTPGKEHEQGGDGAAAVDDETWSGIPCRLY
eukprot:m.1390 g.1390  ORF g.1390 m.1390 type:complete len:57 (-) comp861_c0_seq1:90-260(-)